MPDFTIGTFKFGMDQRRARAAGAVSTLWDLENAHITRGGDIQRCKAFVPTYTLPAGCFGLVAIGSTLFVFGSQSAPAVPPGVVYQQLVPAGGTANMLRVVDAVAFLGKTYVIAEYDDGNVYHFYDGSRVTDWDAISQANCSQATLAAYFVEKLAGDPTVSAVAYGTTILLTSLIPGVATTVTATGGGGQTATATVVQAAVAAAPEVASHGSVTITAGATNNGQVSQITVDGVPIMAAPVSWFGDNSQTANAVAVQVNNKSTTTGYFAAASGNVVNIIANPGQGTAPNGKAVAATVTGAVAVNTANMAGGVNAVAAVAQVVTVALGGTFGATLEVSITVGATTYQATGQASGIGLSLYVYLNRIYSCANTHVQYCTLADPSNWSDTDPSSGAGFINIASQQNGSERLVGICGYATYAAIFSARQVVLYSFEADATQVSVFQSMHNQGCIAARSFQDFATTDVFYLDLSGVRSLRERDTTFTAYAADVGSAVDTPVQAWISQVGLGAAAKACSIIEPLDGRYMVAVGSRIWVYSYFPSTQIGAWSHYDPGFTVQAFTAIKEQLYCYDGTTVYLYGGASGQVYPDDDTMLPVITFPFHSPGDPGAFKIWTEIDIIANGVWALTFYPNPNDLSETLNGGKIVNNTYHGPTNNVCGRSQLISMQLTCSSAGYADFSSITLNYLRKDSK